MALSTAADIATAIGTANAAAAVAGAVAGIEAEVGPLETEEQTLIIPGVFTHRLNLYRRPLTSVTSVEVNGEAVDAATYRVLRRGALVKINPTSWWGGTDVDVEVVCDAGFPVGEVPQWIEQMVESVARRAIAAPDGITQESFGDYSVTYGHARDGLSTRQRLELRTKFGLGMRVLST